LGPRGPDPPRRPAPGHDPPPRSHGPLHPLMVGAEATPEPGRVAAPERGPAVLIVGGLLTSWLWYWPVEARFKARGASRVAVAPLWLWQWLVAGFLGPGRAASLVAASVDPLAACDRRPILVVG